MKTPNTIAQDAVNDIRDFLQRAWKLAENKDNFQLIPEAIRSYIAKHPELEDHQLNFFISALNAAQAEALHRQQTEYEVKIIARNKQDRHADCPVDVEF